MNKKAVVLLSGGLDSCTVLAMAKDQGFDCFALSFDYGQRHEVELEAASLIAESSGVIEHKVFALGFDALGGSALTDNAIDVPDYDGSESIPVTYVPARNTVFLSIALAWAEVIGANDIFLGVSAVDYSGYPDCRPEFIEAFQNLANLATKAGVEGNAIQIHAPLIDLSKAQTIQKGINLGVDYSKTISCYQPDEQGQACGRCDSCMLRKFGFEEAGVEDPTKYI